MTDDFYRAFEEKHRGSRELIKGRQRVYVPFISPLVARYPQADAIDLGCGRGEWLELLFEGGFNALGVDLDEGMLRSCRERNLRVERGDALAALARLPDESQAVVSAMHVVEHISFADLRVLVSEAHRVLKPGGILIMETPNPENIIVATRNFYLDPTHLRPIPSELLSFLPEYCGFARVKTIRLHEPQSLVSRSSLHLHDVLGGVSPDYAVIAQKGGSPELESAGASAFRAEYGLSLEKLAHQYDQQIQAGLQEAANRATTAEQDAERWRNEAERHSERVAALLSSTSWRVTKPLRAASRVASGDFSDAKRASARVREWGRRAARAGIRRAMTFLSERPGLRAQAVGLVTRVPWLHRKLQQAAAHASHTSPAAEAAGGFELHHMSTQVQQVFAALKREIETHRR